MARPRAASSRIEPSDKPLKAWPSRSPMSSLRLTWARLVSAAVRTVALVSTSGCSRFSRRVRASGSPVSPSKRTALKRTAGSGSTSCRLASARLKAACTSWSVSSASCWSRNLSCAGLADFCNCWAALSRSFGSAASSWWLARAVSTSPRRRLFRRKVLTLPSTVTCPCCRLLISSTRAGVGCAAQLSRSWACTELLAAAKSLASSA